MADTITIQSLADELRMARRAHDRHEIDWLTGLMVRQIAAAREAGRLNVADAWQHALDTANQGESEE